MALVNAEGPVHYRERHRPQPSFPTDPITELRSPEYERRIKLVEREAQGYKAALADAKELRRTLIAARDAVAVVQKGDDS